MSTVQVKINMPKMKVSKTLPSAMVPCKPFLVRRKNDRDEMCVVIRTGSNAFVFFDPRLTDRASYASEENYKWVDENYEVIEGISAEITLTI